MTQLNCYFCIVNDDLTVPAVALVGCRHTKPDAYRFYPVCIECLKSWGGEECTPVLYLNNPAGKYQHLLDRSHNRLMEFTSKDYPPLMIDTERKITERLSLKLQSLGKGFNL